MLNPFPIQFLALFAYFLLRVFVGGILLYLGIHHIAEKSTLQETFRFSWFPHGALSVWLLSITELLLAFLILLGMHTQYAVLALTILSLICIVWNKRLRHPTIPSRIFYVLLIGAALSLFITGAGVLAFDLPI